MTFRSHDGMRPAASSALRRARHLAVKRDRQREFGRAFRGECGISSRNARHASGGSTGHLCLMSTGRSPSPFPFFSHPLLLIQAVYSGGVVSELRALQQPGLG
eukprot:scaffold2007_cov123-Isochrysis_galbana.AAC.5